MTTTPKSLPIESPELPLEDPGDVQARDPESQNGGAGRSEEILHRVVPGDPLGVRVQVARRLVERCLLLDPHGISVQVLASIAADQWKADPSADSKLTSGLLAHKDCVTQHLVESTVDQVIDDCIAGRIEVPLVGFPRGGILTQLSKVLKLHQLELKRACDRFNCLPAEARRAFHALVLQRRSLESACRRSASAAEVWSQGAARGLRDIVGGAGGAPKISSEGKMANAEVLGERLLAGRGQA